MNRCPITYEPCGEQRYSQRGLAMLSSQLKDLKDFPYSQVEQRIQAKNRATKMSVAGVQTKVSAVLSIKNQAFEIVDACGVYIIKPQSADWSYVPENEDLTMKLAETVGIETPVHGLIYSEDNTLSYFIKRYDRVGNRLKIAQEDFTQLSGATRATKYNSSMEKVAKVIEDKCTDPAVEKQKLLKLVLFNYIVGNEDMHLKNFSLITKNNVVQLSPAYDLVNTTIVCKTVEEIALPIKGKKKNLTKKILIDYYGVKKLGLSKTMVDIILNDIIVGMEQWGELIDISFLSDELKNAYFELVEKRKTVIL